MDAQVLLVRVWSNGLEAHHIKGENESYSVQIVTMTVIGPNYQNTDYQTVPFALCFQRQNQNDYPHSAAQRVEKALVAYTQILRRE